MKKLDKFVIATMILLISFVVTMEVFFVIYREIPDTLVTCVLGTGVFELIITSLIKIMGDKYDSNTNNSNNNADAPVLSNGHGGSNINPREDG